MLKIETDDSLNPIKHRTLEKLILDAWWNRWGVGTFFVVWYNLSIGQASRGYHWRYSSKRTWVKITSLKQWLTVISSRVDDVSLESRGAPKLIISDLDGLLSHEMESFIVRTSQTRYLSRKDLHARWEIGWTRPEFHRIFDSAAGWVALTINPGSKYRPGWEGFNGWGQGKCLSLASRFGRLTSKVHICHFPVLPPPAGDSCSSCESTWYFFSRKMAR